MAITARMITSLPADQREQFAARAAAEGISVSQLLARLVRKANALEPGVRIERLNASALNDKAPAEKYTVRLMGADAAQLEERALLRQVTPSGYVAHLLRAHLRANPPMPYKEFQELKRIVNELEAIRRALQQVRYESSAAELLNVVVSENLVKLLTPLKVIRQQIQDTLVSNSKSWETLSG